MFYEFPEIHTIHDVLPAIQGAKEFNVIDRGPITVINYQVVMEDTFPPIESHDGSAKDCERLSKWKAIRRECRGLIFDRATGEIKSRRYHKFFNMNERPETQADKINWKELHNVLEKIDGSMITIEDINGEYVAMTKMGITDVAQQAQGFLDANPQYIRMVDDLSPAFTCIFEWVSRSSRIVVDYPNDNLILTGIRDKITGKYFDYFDLLSVEDTYKIPIVKCISVNKGIDLATLESLEGQEGVVIRFDETGHMLKVKTPWYVLRHASKDTLMREKGVLELIFNEQVDDVIPFLEGNDANRLVKFKDAVLKGVKDTANNLLTNYEKYHKISNYDRKRFALEVAPNINNHVRAIMFRLWDQPDVEDIIYGLVFDLVKANISTVEKLESVRHFIGYQRWKYY